MAPGTPDELHRVVRALAGVEVPRQAAAEGSLAPFEYLVAAYFEGEGRENPGLPPRAIEMRQAMSGGELAGAVDLVVWANRGGGKTFLGAVATLLDLLFKPGVQVRILGGSLEQSAKMYGYLKRMVDRPGLRALVVGEPTQRRIELANGSAVELLSQSQRSVRGTRVHKLRCDEVEEFEPEVWRAAQMVTKSGWCGGKWVRGTVEALSTMHRPYGLMHELVERAKAGKGARLIKWCALDVVERCGEERKCAGCAIEEDCGGVARGAKGFMAVGDLVAQRQRTTRETWEAEMLCRRPVTRDCVYRGVEGVVVESAERSRGCTPAASTGVAGPIVAGMDFGLRSPVAVVWGVVRQEEKGDVLEIVAEYTGAGLTLEEHVGRMGQVMAAAGIEELKWIGVDPAGGARNFQTGKSDVEVLRGRGFRVRARRSSVREGIERVQRRLEQGRLVIQRRCVELIKAMETYHYDARRPDDEEPVKDGPDHLCDALRYLVVNLEMGEGKVERRRWA